MQEVGPQIILGTLVDIVLIELRMVLHRLWDVT